MEPDRLEELIALGIYDPDADDAPERLELLEFLVDLGATPEQMLEVAHLPGGLAGMASIAGSPPATVSLAEIARRVDIDPVEMGEDWTALGLPLGDLDAPVLPEHEADAVAAVVAASKALPRDAQLAVLRAVGRAVARMGDALVAAFLFAVEPTERSELVRARMAAVGQRTLAANLAALGAVLRLHMTRAAIHLRESRQEAENVLAIGFVDLVGFTPLSLTLDSADLERLLADFERIVTHHITADDAWVIKLIGDEVMFAAADVDTALRVTVDLLDGLARERPDLTPTGGIDVGPVLARGGDYFGSVVNLAARVASVAVPGEVLVTRAVRDGATALPAEHRLEPSGRRQLKGIPDAVELWALRRGPADP